MPNMIISANYVLDGYFIQLTKQSNFKFVKVVNIIKCVFVFSKTLVHIVWKQENPETKGDVLYKPKELNVAAQHRKLFGCHMGRRATFCGPGVVGK